jgi:GABA permease
VCPAAPSSSLRHWTSDVDGARAHAQETLDGSLARLREGAIEGRGAIGDEDPFRAIEDALRTFGADEIVVATGADDRGRAVAAGVRERFAMPITHVEAEAQAGSRT